MSPPYAYSAAHFHGAMDVNHQRLPDMGQRGHDQQNSPGPYIPIPQRPVVLESGFMILLPTRKQLKIMNWAIPDRINPGIFGHPALIIDHDDFCIRIVLVTSHSGREFEALARYKQLQHLPIAPSPYARTGEQLQMRVGQTRCPSYIKAHESWWLPKRIISRGNIDEYTGEQLLMKRESFHYVWQLVREYEGTNSIDWYKHKSKRPFPKYSSEVFPHGYSPGTASSSSSGSPPSQKSSLKSPLHDSGTAANNGKPSDQSDRAPQSPQERIMSPPQPAPSSNPAASDTKAAVVRIKLQDSTSAQSSEAGSPHSSGKPDWPISPRGPQ